MKLPLFVATLVAAAVLTVPACAGSIFSDNFDAGVNGSVWEANPAANTYILVGDNAHAFGAQSAKQVQADPFIYYMRTKVGAFPAPASIGAGLQEILTTWMWDDNVQSGAQTMAGVMLANSALTDFYQLQVNSTKSWTNYCWRTSQDGTFVTSVARSAGWHEFQIVANPYTGSPTSGQVKFYIDGVLAAQGSRKGNYTLDQVRLGISLKTPGSNFWYDNVDVSVVPEPSPLLALGAGFTGLMTLLRRRSVQ